MAHRQPLGSMFTSTFDWDGDHPSLLDYLVSPADTWYLVVGVQEKRNPRKVGLTLERIARPDPVRESIGGEFRYLVGDGQRIALVHEFVWHSRDRRRA